MKGISRRAFVQGTLLTGSAILGLPAASAVVAEKPFSPLPPKKPNSMRIYIITDLEGAAMVSRFDQTRDATPEATALARKLLTAEVNAAVNGILDMQADADIIVWDGHGGGGIDITELHRAVRLIARGPIEPPYFLDETFDGVFFVGQHAMAGTPNGNLCHTYSSKTVEYFKINGQLVGEFGARAIMAGTFGVPVIYISGDDKAVAEAKAMVPNICGAVVKWGLGVELALHLSPDKAQNIIRNMARMAIRNIRAIKPVKVNPPYEQEIRVYEGQSIEGYLKKKGAAKVDDRTVVIRSDNVCDLHV
jgi:D-amino peptidase